MVSEQPYQSGRESQVAQRLLEGDVVEGAVVQDSELESLRDQLTGVRAERDQLRHEVGELKTQLKQQAQVTILVRKHMGPFYQVLRAMFGEIDKLGPETVTEDAPPTTNGASPKWESWKQKMPGSPAEVITSLLEHGEANVKQLCVLCKRGENTIYSAIVRLNKAGLLSKNGGKYSLKAL